jgi:ribose-phosphate pyrophosphokinase
MPYIPNARMDRVKNPDEVFTLKSFAKILNAMDFKAVIVDNAHSDVSRALIDNIQDNGLQTIQNFLENHSGFETIMFPDAGACKRYSTLDVVKDNYDIVVGEKTRDWRSGKILGLEIKGNLETIKDKDILIIDDICSKGGTFKYSAIELKKLGAKNIYLYISHCENVIDIEALKEAGITKVFTTNSIYRGTNDFVEVC